MKSEIFHKSIYTAANHLARAREGAALLAEGKSLSEMTTPITGLTSDETLERRTEYLNQINSMDEASLKSRLVLVEKQIDVALSREVQGTSELYWQRIIILDRLSTFVPKLIE